MARKKPLGRQRIPMKKIANTASLHTTFSKRRGGIFTKAGELCTLCGPEIAVIIFSPGGKAFCFGHPSVNSVEQHFLSNNQAAEGSELTVVGENRNENIRKLKRKYNDVSNLLELEKMPGESLRQGQKTPTVGNINLYELKNLHESMGELKMKVKKQFDEWNGSSSSSTVPNQSGSVDAGGLP